MLAPHKGDTGVTLSKGAPHGRHEPDHAGAPVVSPGILGATHQTLSGNLLSPGSEVSSTGGGSLSRGDLLSD